MKEKKNLHGQKNPNSALYVLLILLISFSFNLFSCLPFFRGNEILRTISSFMQAHSMLVLAILFIILTYILRAKTLVAKDENLQNEELIQQALSLSDTWDEERRTICREASTLLATANMLDCSLENVGWIDWCQNCYREWEESLRCQCKKNYSVQIKSAKKMSRLLFKHGLNTDSPDTWDISEKLPTQ